MSMLCDMLCNEISSLPELVHHQLCPLPRRLVLHVQVMEVLDVLYMVTLQVVP